MRLRRGTSVSTANAFIKLKMILQAAIHVGGMKEILLKSTCRGIRLELIIEKPKNFDSKAETM